MLGMGSLLNQRVDEPSLVRPLSRQNHAETPVEFFDDALVVASETSRRRSAVSL